MITSNWKILIQKQEAKLAMGTMAALILMLAIIELEEIEAQETDRASKIT